MGAVVVDTHTAIWYLIDSGRLSSRALAVLDESAESDEPVYVASISLVEAAYLVEKARVPEAAVERLYQAVTGIDRNLELVVLDRAVAQAVRRIPRDLVPDMPDRIIAATALHLSLPLVTRDRRIQAASIQTIW